MIAYFISALLYFGDFYPTEAILPETVGIYYYKVGKSKRRKGRSTNTTFIPQKSKSRKGRNYTTRDKMK